MRTFYRLLLCSVCVAGAPLPAFAATGSAAPEATMLPELIVTAEKRETNVQRTPMAIEALSAETLQARMITNIEGLATALPNVQFGVNNGQARVSLRSLGTDAIGQGNEGRVAFHQDGVYLGHPEAQMIGYFDVERIEVVYGPQGTLYGRNATGGAVNLISRAPIDDFNGYIRGSFGNFSAVRLEGAAGGQIMPGVAGRLAFMTNDHAGYGHNLFNGEDVEDSHIAAVRGKLKFALGHAANLTLAADYMREKDHAFGYHLIGQGGLTPGNPPLKGVLYGGMATTEGWDVASDSGPNDRRSFFGVTADLRAPLGAFEFRSITAYRSQEVDLQTDLDQTTAPLTLNFVKADARTWSEELQLNRDFGRGNFMLGAFYYRDEFDGGNQVVIPRAFLFPFPAPLDLKQGITKAGRLKTDAYAFFANLRYEVTDELTLRAGLRYSREKKSVDELSIIDIVTPWPPTQPFGTGCRPTNLVCQPQVDSKVFDSLNPSVTLQYQPASQVMFYATYSTGFKSGGYNLGSSQKPFRPERINDLEGGAKSTWLDGKVRLNAAIFYYRYDDLQLTRNNGTVVEVVNAAAAIVKGGELSLTALPTTSLKLEANVGLLDAKYKSFFSADSARPSLGVLNLSGNRLTQAPQYTVNLAAEYSTPIGADSVSLRIEEQLVGEAFYTPFNLKNQAQSAYTRTNVFLRFRPANDRWNLSLYCRNLEDRRIRTNAFTSAPQIGVPIVGSYQEPRVYGIEAEHSF
jgi:iron complex outermembrane receptor protein